ncbi:hypothetical protein [Rosistilla oblonga]|uniref:hypothetical protein n=1 Tax=Rosistilla oblonga TaxID=2527990 RepID=UPI003A97EE3B
MQIATNASGSDPMACDLNNTASEWLIEQTEINSVVNQRELNLGCGGNSQKHGINVKPAESRCRKTQRFTLPAPSIEFNPVRNAIR